MDVFISYSHDDRAFAERLVQRLDSDGISTWIDYKDAIWGKPFPASIEQGLDRTRHIICLMSPSWTSSAWSSIERYSAMVDDPDGFLGKLLPILLSTDTQIPRFIKPLVYIDCTKTGALDSHYSRIRDHILNTRKPRQQETAGPLLRSLQAGGTHLPPLGYIFVVGHPGAGKSTFCRFLKDSLAGRGISVAKRSDYPFLQALFRLDLARGDTRRFEADAKSEFKVKDLSVYDEALKLIHDEIIAADIVPGALRVVEFSRPHYDSSFLYYTLRALVNSVIVHVDAPLSICEARNESRRKDLERRLAGVEPANEAFDFDADMHYVPPPVYDRYRRDAQEWADQALVLALMPARGYFRIDSSRNDLAAYRTESQSLINQHLAPLIDRPEHLKDFYRRRMAALEAFVSHVRKH
jgi:TIR domain